MSKVLTGSTRDESEQTRPQKGRRTEQIMGQSSSAPSAPTPRRLGTINATGLQPIHPPALREGAVSLGKDNRVRARVRQSWSIIARRVTWPRQLVM